MDLRRRITVVDSVPGKNKPRVTETCRSGFIFSCQEGHEVILRKVGVKTSSQYRCGFQARYNKGFCCITTVIHLIPCCPSAHALISSAPPLARSTAEAWWQPLRQTMCSMGHSPRRAWGASESKHGARSTEQRARKADVSGSRASQISRLAFGKMAVADQSRRFAAPRTRLAGRDSRCADCATLFAGRENRSADCACWSADCATLFAWRGSRFADYATSFAGRYNRSADCARSSAPHATRERGSVSQLHYPSF